MCIPPRRLTVASSAGDKKTSCLRDYQTLIINLRAFEGNYNQMKFQLKASSGRRGNCSSLVHESQVGISPATFRVLKTISLPEKGMKSQ